jgi:hypothetical protein
VHVIEVRTTCLAGENEILIKPVLQSITTYAMGVFKFPAGLTEELSQIIRNFWWGDEENRRRMHWMSWDKMTRPKSLEELGSETSRSLTKLW